jgi:hypothetical protein
LPAASFRRLSLRLHRPISATQRWDPVTQESEPNFFEAKISEPIFNVPLVVIATVVVLLLADG